MNRRNFIKIALATGAALYIPEKAYSFLQADKCSAWKIQEHFAIYTRTSSNWRDGTEIFTRRITEKTDLDPRIEFVITKEEFSYMKERCR